jgi:HlyD family secretion protein
MTRKKLIVASIVAAVVIIAAVAWTRSRHRDGHGALVLYGNVDIREVQMAFRQPGRIASMAVDEGDTVKAGQLLAQLDATPYRETLAATEADVQRAQAQRDKLQAGNRPQQVAQAQEAVRRAEAGLHNAEQNDARQHRLLASGSTSQRNVDAARAARDQAAATLAQARQALSLQRSGFRAEDIAAGKAQLAAAEAARDKARTALADTRLIAPANATVLSRVLEPGSMVVPSSPVYTLSLRDPVYVRAYVAETALGRIAPGTKVQVHTDSSDKTYHGQIGFISSAAEFTPKSVETTELRTDLVYRLRIVVVDADQGLRQGMPVTVNVAVANAGAEQH